MRTLNQTTSKTTSRIMQTDTMSRILEAAELRRRRYRSEAMRQLVARCPEHLFSTDSAEMKPLH